MLQVRSLAILVAGLLLSSCVVTQQDLQMQRDILEMKRRLGEAERAVKEVQDDTSGGVRAHVETLAGNQADFQAELDGLRVDLQSMQGRTGDQERINDELRQDLTLLRDELSLQVADHEQRLAKLDAGMAAASVAPPAVSPSSTPAVAPPVATTPAGESARSCMTGL